MATTSNRKEMEREILARTSEIMESVVNPQGLDIHIYIEAGCVPIITYTVKDDIVIEKGEK